GGQAHPGGVAAGRPGAALDLSPQASAEPVDPVAVLRWLYEAEAKPRLLPAALALGDGAVARAARRLHAGPGFDRVAARGRPPGRGESRVHPGGPQAVF